MNRSQFLNAVSERAGAHRRDVEHVWENALVVIQDAIKKGDKVGITGFGNFKQRVRKARMAINPRTGEQVKVAATKLPKFLPAKQFKQYVAGQVKSLPSVATKPMALAAEAVGAKKPAAKKAAAAKKPAAKKAAPKKAAPKKAAAKKPAAKKKAPAKKR